MTRQELIAILVGGLILTACSSNGPNEASGTHPAVSSVTTVNATGAPYGVAISRDGKTYVSLLNNSSVVQGGDPLTSLGTPIAVGALPPHVVFSPDGKRAYTANQSGNSVTVIDVEANSAIDTIPLGGNGFNLIVTADGAKLFVSTASGKVYVITTSNDAIVDSLQLGAAVNGFARHPSKKLIYISSRDGGTVSEVSTTSNDVVRTFTLGGQPQRLAVSPNGRELLVADEATGVQVWNLRTGEYDTTIAVAAYGLGLSPDGDKVYVTDPLGGNIRIIDRASRAVDTTLNVGGTPRNVAFNRNGDEAIITNEADFVTVVH